MSNKRLNADTLDRMATRRQVPPPTRPHKDKSKYTRKNKHKSSEACA